MIFLSVAPWVFLGGFVYGITPGPGVLAVFGLGAAQGRRAAAAFLCGHLAGDGLWCGAAMVAILGARSIGGAWFDALGVVSGAYLLWLGLRALRARRVAGGDVASAIGRPLWHGVAFGLTNPKSYPVAVATFTALLSSRAAALSWGDLPSMVLASLLGGVLAYAILVGVVGASRVRVLYRRYQVAITRLSGAMFVGFALTALWHAVPGVLGVLGIPGWD